MTATPHRPGAAHAGRSSLTPAPRGQRQIDHAARTSRSLALADGWHASPRLALANAVVQLLSGTLIRLHDTPVREAMRDSGASRAYVAALTGRYPLLLTSPEPGVLTAAADDVALLDALMLWDDRALTGLLTFLLGGLVEVEESGHYLRRVAQLSGAQERLAQHFTLTRAFLDVLTLAQLRALIEDIPESVRPIVLGTERAVELRDLLEEKARLFAEAGWVPHAVRF